MTTIKEDNGTYQTPEKNPYEMTKAEFIEAYRNSFVRHPGRRVIAGVLINTTIWPLPPNCQAYGFLTRAVEDVLGEIHKKIVFSQIQLHVNCMSSTALPYVINAKPVPPEVLAEYPELS